MEVTVMDMLAARDLRAERQHALLARYGKTLLCFTMNIAGPVKRTPLIEQGFSLGVKQLERRFLRLGIAVIAQRTEIADTGCEAFFVVDAPARPIKRIAVEIEEETPAGRLYDMDVMEPGGRKLSREEIGMPGRRCLLCGGEAKACARSRAHSVEQLRQRTQALLREALRGEYGRTIAHLACRALLYEVNVTPKPGLVDRRNSGSHRDMNVFTFSASAAALWPYFERCAHIGYDTAALEPAQTFARLREAGKAAEGEMLYATGGVNTHKGAIFSMGLLCGAMGRLPGAWGDSDRLLRECAAMTAGLTAADFAGLTQESAATSGQRLYLAHGVAGVRGEAERGFPLVRHAGLPMLEEALAEGRTEDEAGCAALLAMIAENMDTNVIHRSSMQTQKRIQEQARALLARERIPSRRALEALDDEWIGLNVSPGGSADLLAICWLMHFAKEEAPCRNIRSFSSTRATDSSPRASTSC